MKRLLLFVGVAVVAAAMYVAASPASQQSSGPTAKQFNALKKQVASLSKTVKVVKALANGAAGVIANCYLTTNGNTVNFAALPVSQFGISGPGFLFGSDASSAVPRTALDVDTGPFPEFYFQTINPNCINTGQLRHGAARSAGKHVQHRSQQAKGPTEKQFLALKKQVATISKTMKAVGSVTNAVVEIENDCYLSSDIVAKFLALPGTQFGNSSVGFLFGTPSSSTPRTALDLDTGPTPGNYLQGINSSCVTGALKHNTVHSAATRVLNWADRTR
jgi:hypothetical protein